MEEPPRSAGSPVPGVYGADFSQDLHNFARLLQQPSLPLSEYNANISQFLDNYEAQRNNQLWVSQHSEEIASIHLVSLALDHYDRLESKNFLRLLLFCASMNPQQVASLFKEGQASCEVLQTMENSLKDRETRNLGAQILALASASHSKFRSAIASGDGVSLFVEVMKEDPKDVYGLCSLFISMANMSFHNKENKTAFVENGGLDVFVPALKLCESMQEQPSDTPNGDHQPNSNQVKSLAGATLTLLRNMSTLAATSSSIDNLMVTLKNFCSNYLIDKPKLLESALFCFIGFLTKSVTNKTRFVTKLNGLTLLKQIFDTYAEDASIMRPATVVLQLVAKINAYRQMISRIGFLPLLLVQWSNHPKEPSVLLPTAHTLYQLLFCSKTRPQVSTLPEICKILLSSLSTNHPSPRLHACTSKLIIKLCTVDSCKRQVIESGVGPILTPMNLYSGETRVTKFMARIVNIALSSVPQASSTSNGTKSNTNNSNSKNTNDSDSYSSSDSSSDASSDTSESSSNTDEDDNQANNATHKSKPPTENHKPEPVAAATPNTPNVTGEVDFDSVLAELESGIGTKKPATGTGNGNAITANDKVNDNAETLSNDIKSLQSELSEVKSQNFNAHQQIGELQNKIVLMTVSAQSAIDAYSDVKTQSQSLETQNAAMKSQVDSLSLQLTAALQAKERALQEAIAAQQQTQQQYSQPAEDHSKLVEERDKLLVELQLAKESRDEALGMITTLQQQNSDYESQLAHLNSEINTGNSQMESKLLNLQETLMAVQASAVSHDDYNAAKLRISELESQIQEFNQTKKNPGQENSMESESTNLKKQINDLQLQLQNLSSSNDNDRHKIIQQHQQDLQQQQQRFAAESAQQLQQSKSDLESKSLELELSNQRIASLEQELLQKAQQTAALTSNLEETTRQIQALRAAQAGANAISPLGRNSSELVGHSNNPALNSKGVTSSPRQVFTSPDPFSSEQQALPSSYATGDSARINSIALNHSSDNGKNNHSTIATTESSLEKEWIRLEDHQTQVATLKDEITRLHFDLEDALEHVLHFQILSIRLDYHSRGEEAPSTETIRKNLTDSSVMRRW